MSDGCTPARPSETDFGRAGFTILAAGLSSIQLAALREASDVLQRSDTRARAGIRDPLAAAPVFSETERALRPIAEALVGSNVIPVRSILFDKTPETNWDVVWHQDVTIAVSQRIEIDGFGPWSSKQGIPHVQPPASVLEQMVTLRLHLDDCPTQNGPLLVMPGSHLAGFVDVRTLDAARCDREAFACIVSAGDIVAMRPLLLHASKKSAEPTHRRVLHIEYATGSLPSGLGWPGQER